MALTALAALILFLVGVVPSWNHSGSLGCSNLRNVGLVLVITLVFLLIILLPHGF